MKINFIKMNGAGNDFVVIDARKNDISLSDTQIRALSARDNKIITTVTKNLNGKPPILGCDQLLILEKSEKADVFMRIYNADGGQVDACGNATRCIADMLYKELERLPVTIETNVAILRGVRKQEDYILVDMGEPKFEWQDIPLSMTIEEATARIKEKFGLENPIFVSIGNPHVVFFVEELPSDEEMAKIGSQIENCTEIFPQRVNVSFAKTHSDFVIFAKTWERGAGLTKACGTGACAMLAAAKQYEIKMNNAFVKFTSYEQMVSVAIRGDNHILLGGEIEVEFEGVAEI